MANTANVKIWNIPVGAVAWNASIGLQINGVVNNWPIYAEETKVNADLRDAISKTLINLDN